MIAGLTGGIGSGKTAVSDALHRRFGIPVTDADQLARDVVAAGMPAFEAIVERYPQALKPDGTLDRAWLREHVLPDDDARHWLESVTHPEIRVALVRALEHHKHTGAYQILASPLLLETGQSQLCDCVVVVDATEEQQVERAGRRDHNDEALIRSIMSKQWPRHRRLQAAHFVVDNTGSESALTEQILQLHQQLLEYARHHE